MLRPAVDVNFKAAERSIRNFVRKSDFVLSVIVVPNVHPTILRIREEKINKRRVKKIDLIWID